MSAHQHGELPRMPVPATTIPHGTDWYRTERRPSFVGGITFACTFGVMWRGHPA